MIDSELLKEVCAELHIGIAEGKEYYQRVAIEQEIHSIDPSDFVGAIESIKSILQDMNTMPVEKSHHYKMFKSVMLKKQEEANSAEVNYNP